MRTTLCTLAMLTFTTVAHAEVPRGADAINGAFARMLAHSHETPPAIIVRGEPDPLAVMVSTALQLQCPAREQLAMQGTGKAVP
jgi:hypothetical protein